MTERAVAVLRAWRECNAVFIQCLFVAKDEKITIRLTRDQAEQLRKRLNDCYGEDDNA